MRRKKIPLKVRLLRSKKKLTRRFKRAMILTIDGKFSVTPNLLAGLELEREPCPESFPRFVSVPWNN